MKPLNWWVSFPLQKETKTIQIPKFQTTPTSLFSSGFLSFNTMMSPDSIPDNPVTDDNQSSGGRKTGSLKPPEQTLTCPRCDSPNTKFCYYNNYSLTQPRHFCKTCRRYWTKGGALRNVPIGGGCRKNKKTKSGSRLCGDSSETSGLKSFHGLTTGQLGGVYQYNHFVPFGDLTSATTTTTSAPPCFEIDASASSASLMDFNYPVSSVFKQGGTGGFNGGIHQDMCSMNVHTSIESLSSINQELHWNLQQQRLAMLFGGETQKESSVSCENHAQKPQPISFQSLEISKPEAVDVSIPSGNTTGLFFENSCTPTTTNTNSGSKGNNNTSNWNGIQAWTDLQQYNALP